MDGEAREIITGKGTSRQEISESLQKDWFGALLQTAFVLSVIFFFGLIVLGPLGLAPAKSEIYLYIPGFWIAVWAVQWMRGK